MTGRAATGTTLHSEGTDINREWLLAAGSVLITVVTAVALLRWLAPQLLGIPADLQLVQASETVPPFFENIFREQDFSGDGLLLHDPYTNTRFRPLLPADGTSGPHDILGFRNSGIPNHPAVIVIGDSQTYGFGEPFANNWPSQMATLLQDGDSVYSMAVGGWGAVQYLDMAGKAILLQPQALIVAFYTGNDPLDAFATAYGNDHWQSLRVDPELDKEAAPEIGSLLSLENVWPVRFADGTYIVFTPRGRLTVNDTGHPAVRTGYAIMAEVARRIIALARQHDISVIFTIIPTRELVYAEKVTQAQLDTPETYRQLVSMEQKNIESLAGSIRNLPGARYVDLVQPLQAAALADTALYPRQWDGHPGRQGYAVIARTLAHAVARSVSPSHGEGGRLLHQRPAQ
jgi:lysophospholipase L1-like esterase